MPTLEEIYKLVQDLNPPVKRIEVDLGGGIQFLRVEEIVFITTDDKRLKYVTAGGQELYNFNTLAKMEKILAENRNFMRTHRSYIVNLDHVDRIEKKDSSYIIYFTSLPEQTASLSESNVKALKQYFSPKPE